MKRCDAEIFDIKRGIEYRRPNEQSKRKIRIERRFRHALGIAAWCAPSHKLGSSNKVERDLVHHAQARVFLCFALRLLA